MIDVMANKRPLLTRKPGIFSRIAVLILLVSAVTVYAQTREIVKNFLHSKVARDFGFVLDSTIDTGPYSTTPGKEKRAYLSKNKRYVIEIVASKETGIIDQQNLSYHLDEKLTSASDDKRCALEFIQEASGGKIEEAAFLALYEDAPRNIGVKQEKVMGGFVVAVAIYRNALFREWNITVSYQKN